MKTKINAVDTTNKINHAQVYICGDIHHAEFNGDVWIEADGYEYVFDIPDQFTLDVLMFDKFENIASMLFEITGSNEWAQRNNFI